MTAWRKGCRVALRPLRPYNKTVQRLESSKAGRVLISIGILAVLGGILTWNLPPSELARRTQPVFQRFMFGAGLDQNWSVFAPDPPQAEVDLQARIVYDDGTERIWEVPTGGPVLGAYWDYRWLKWGEFVSAGIDARLWLPTAEWIARQEQSAGRRPVSVTLFRAIVPLPIGGRGEPTSVDFYRHEVPAAADGPAG